MIGEYFIDTCITACVSIDSSYPQCKDIFMNMFMVFKSYKNTIKKSDIPIDFKDKLDLVYYLSQFRSINKEYDFSQLMSKLQSGRWSYLIPSLEHRKNNISNEEISSIFKMVLDKKKIMDLMQDRGELDSVLSDLESGNFKDEEELATRWEKVVDKLNRNLMNVKKIENIGKVSSLDVMNDDFFPVIDKLRSMIDYENTIKTGYKYIDSKLPSGGFEKRRFYLIGGTSGVGKSAFLINLMCNSIRSRQEEKKDKKRVMLYITAENLIDETWCRLYCCLKGVPYTILLTFITEAYKKAEETQNPEIIDELVKSLKKDCCDELEKANVNVIFKYVQPRKTTTHDLDIIIESIKSEYGDEFECVYIDYLDLFTTGQNLDIRLDTGMIAQEFKNFAVLYDILVVSVTQLNRIGYDVKQDASVTQMSESMKKVDNSDGIIFLQDCGSKPTTFLSGDTVICKHIRVTFLKSRTGESTQQSDMFIMRIKRGEESVFNYRIEHVDFINQEDDITDTSGYMDYDIGTYGDENHHKSSKSNNLRRNKYEDSF